MPAARTAAICFLLAVSTDSFAGRIPEEWDDLPQVGSISFSETSVALITRAGQYFILDRASNKLRQLDKDQFAQAWRAPLSPRAAEVKQQTGVGSTVALYTSSGKVYTTRNAYCSEGEEAKHGLWLGDAPVADHVDPCVSIGAAEVVGNQLWLGTRHDGEYGEYPADGIVVQALDTGARVAQVGTEQGLSGNLIRAIRVDPFANTIWVSTERGINEVDREIRVLRSQFFYQDFDPSTGVPTFSLVPKWRKSNPLVSLFKRLGLKDAKAFYDAAKQIPPALRNEFEEKTHQGAYHPANARTVEKSFAPREMNMLVPFLIEAARSVDDKARVVAISTMCTLNDPRAVEYLIEQSKSPRIHDDWLIPPCIGKFAKFGLMPEAQKSAYVETMLKRQTAELALAADRSQRANAPLIVEAAKSLKKAGDLRGMESINEFFRNADARSINTGLYEYVGQNLVYDDEITPAMIEGLKKIRGGFSSRGCQFFDMRWNFMPRRFDARYAEAIVIAIANRPASDVVTTGDDYCIEALKSQLANPDVRGKFLKDVYPNLTPPQRAVVDNRDRGQQ